MTLSHPVTTLSLQSSLSLELAIFPFLLPPWSWEEEYDIDVSFKAEHFIVSYSLKFTSFCINLHLLKEKASLVKGER